MKIMKKADVKRKLGLIAPSDFMAGHTDVELYEYAKTLVARFKSEKHTEEEARALLEHADKCHEHLRSMKDEQNTDNG